MMRRKRRRREFGRVKEGMVGFFELGRMVERWREVTVSPKLARVLLKEWR
jgi:hypothetical protein